jgi:hypothetical protein
MKRHTNRINNRKNLQFEKKFEKYNSVNLLRKSDFDLFPVPNSKKELSINIRKIICAINDSKGIDSTYCIDIKTILAIKLFDYLVLHKDIILSCHTFKVIVCNKLKEFSKERNFGPMRSKYYIRILFPDDKCIHESTQTGKLCAYKKYKKFNHCRTHYHFIQSYIQIIENNTNFYSTIISLIVYYL